MFLLGAAVLAVLFAPWGIAWVRFALSDDLASYVLLIPFVTLSLFWGNRRSTPAPAGVGRGSGLAALAALAATALFAALAVISARGATDVTRHDYLAPAVLAFLCSLVACACFTLGGAVVRRHAFGICFAGFAAPLPSWAVNGLEIFFQYTSAEAAAGLMQLAGIPTLRSGLVFQLAGITIQVAQECSGIRSSLVLFIVSIYGGYLILHTRSRRLWLALFVIPLAIFRNGFRILTIAALCTHVGPHMIESPIHHRGGPIFFALSLIPLFLFLLLLRRSERRRNDALNRGGLGHGGPAVPSASISSTKPG